MERLLGRHEVVPLPSQELEATLLFLVLFDGQRIHRTQFVERVTQLLRLRAQRIRIEVELFKSGQQILEGTTPFGFETLTDRLAATGEFRVTQLRPVQLFPQGGGATACVIEQALGLVERRVGGGHRPLSTGQTRVGIRKGLLFGVQLSAPAVKLLRQTLVRFGQVGELARQRLETSRRGGVLLVQAFFAIDRDRQARLRLGLGDLPRGTRFARLLLIALGHRHPFARVGDLGVSLTRARMQRFGLLGQLLCARVELLETRDQPLGQRTRLL